jgi:Ca2+/Na+ antiporter
MSFREKSAWITFILLLVVFGFYFVSFGAAFFAGEGRLEAAHSDVNAATARTVAHVGFFVLMGLLVVAIIVGEIVLHIIIAVRSPAEANAPQDERERLIALKAKRPAYYVLATTAFLSIAVLSLGGGAWALANGILFAMWLGELTNYGAQIYFYRRGA